MISESFKQELLARVDIVDVIDARVPLKKAGANYTARCPFHTEKSPSFTVSQSKQFYHCFGCQAHGNAISFLMEYSGLGYIDAMRELADSVGMKLPAYEPKAGAKPAEGPPPVDLFELMAKAMQFYRDALKQAPHAIDYLKGRGLSGKVAARFGLGYAPADFQALQAVFADYDDQALVDCGLVIVSENGRRYDRFRDRIMFPIINPRGQVIGFGGRVLGQGEPKYLNSPETTLFEKRRELYGLREAREALRATDRVIVVEGYMDVVALAQYGVDNAVATLGTATTQTHITKLLRQVNEIVFCFDGDAAGRKAAWNALDVALGCLPDGKLIRFLLLPPEHDPDSFVRAEGTEAFNAMAAGAAPLSSFLCAELARRYPPATAEGRAHIVNEARGLLGKMTAPALKLQLIREIARISEIEPEDLGRLVGQPSARPAPVRQFDGAPPWRAANTMPPRVDPVRSGLVRERKLERSVLECVLAQPQLAGLIPEGFRTSEYPEGQALGAVLAVIRDGEQSTQALLGRFEQGPHSDVVAAIAADMLKNDWPLDQAEPELIGALRQIELSELESRIAVLRSGKGAQDQWDPADKREYGELIQRLGTLKRSLRSESKAV